MQEKYGLLNNMGYSTKQHMEAIKKYGVTEYHRKSFSPCNKKYKLFKLFFILKCLTQCYN